MNYNAIVAEHVKSAYLAGFDAKCAERGAEPVKVAGVMAQQGYGMQKRALSPNLIAKAGPQIMERLLGKAVTSSRSARPGLMTRISRVGTKLEQGGRNMTSPITRQRQAALIDLGEAGRIRDIGSAQQALTRYNSAPAPATVAAPAGKALAQPAQGMHAAAPAAPAAAGAAPAAAAAAGAAPAAAAAVAKGRGMGNAFMTSAPIRGVRGFLKDLGGGRARHLGNKLNLADRALADARNALQLPAGAGAADTAAFNELLAPLTQRAEQLRRLHQRAVAARFKARLGAGGAAGAYMLGKNRGYGAAGEAALNDYYG